MHNSSNGIAAGGLALGGVFGLVGAMVPQQHVQAILWAIDAAGLVMASALLAVKYFRTGNDIVAGRFLVFAIGEGVLLSGTAAGPAGSVPAFAAGSALWATALLLVSIPKLFAITSKGAVCTPYGCALLKRSMGAFDELRQGVKDISSLTRVSVRSWSDVPTHSQADCFRQRLIASRVNIRACPCA